VHVNPGNNIRTSFHLALSFIDCGFIELVHPTPNFERAERLAPQIPESPPAKARVRTWIASGVPAGVILKEE